MGFSSHIAGKSVKNSKVSSVGLQRRKKEKGTDMPVQMYTGDFINLP